MIKWLFPGVGNTARKRYALQADSHNNETSITCNTRIFPLDEFDFNIERHRKIIDDFECMFLLLYNYSLNTYYFLNTFNSTFNNIQFVFPFLIGNIKKIVVQKFK